MMTTTNTQAISRRYFDAWTDRDQDAVRALLSPDLSFQFVADGVISVDGRDAFLSAEAWPEGVEVKMLAEAYQDNRAFQMYEATHNGVTLRVVETFHIADDRIANITFVTDSQSYAAFKAA